MPANISQPPIAKSPAPPSQHAPPVAVLATLGGKAQVLTFALDCLLAQQPAPNIQRVYGLHFAPTDDNGVQTCLGQLRHEFGQHPAYVRHEIRFDSISIRERPSLFLDTVQVSLSGRAIPDSDDYAAADAIWMTINRLIDALHEQGFVVAMIVTGGPRLISLQAISAASLLFASHDQCYHLFTPEDIRDAAGHGAILHSADPRLRLVDVPLLPMGRIAPGLRDAASATPQEVVGTRRAVLDAQERRCCDEVLQHLTRRQRDVLRAFVVGDVGLTVNAVADGLGISHKTVDGYKTAIFDECRNTWSIGKDVRLTHHFLREKFGDLDAMFWQRWDGAI